MKKKNILFTFLIFAISIFISSYGVKAATLYDEYTVKYKISGGDDYTGEVFYHAWTAVSETGCSGTKMRNPETNDFAFSSKSSLSKEFLEGYGVTGDSTLCIETIDPIGYYVIEGQDPFKMPLAEFEGFVLTLIKVDSNNDNTIIVNIKDSDGEAIEGTTKVRLTSFGLYEKEYDITSSNNKIEGLSKSNNYVVEIITPPEGYELPSTESKYKSEFSMNGLGTTKNVSLTLNEKKTSKLYIYSLDEDSNAVPIKVKYGKNNIEMKELQITDKKAEISNVFVGDEYIVTLEEYPGVDYFLESDTEQSITITSNSTANRVDFKFEKNDIDNKEELDATKLKVVIKDQFTNTNIQGGEIIFTDSKGSTSGIANGETVDVPVGQIKVDSVDAPSGYKITNIDDLDGYKLEAGILNTVTLYAVRNYRFTIEYVNATTRDFMSANFKLCNDKDCKSVIDQGKIDDSYTVEIEQTSADFKVFLISELLDIQKERNYYFSKYTYASSNIPITTSIENIQLNLEEDGIMIEIDRSEEVVDYSIIYKLRDDATRIIGNVEYSFYPSCDSSEVLLSDKSSSENKKTHALENDSVCLKTTKLPQGYNFFEANASSVSLTSENKDMTIYLTFSSSENPEAPEENPEEKPEIPITTGNITVVVLDETGKALSGVQYKLCNDSKCEDPNSDKTLGSYNNLPLGTYYVKITSVPENYVLPKDARKVELTKATETVTIKLEKKTDVPNTLLNVSKIFTVCGIVGMIAGISLLYFNAKKKETA